MNISRIVIASLAVATLLLGGCAVLSSGERNAVESGNSVIVLLRMTATTEKGKALDITQTTRGLYDFGIRANRIGEAEPQYRKGSWRPDRRPSSESWKEGWRYLILSPGTYWLGMTGGVAFYGMDDSNSSTRLWLNVPRGRPVVYAGSLGLTCRTNSNVSFRDVCSRNITVTNEIESARTVARASFADFDPPATNLVQRYGKPITTALLRNLSPIALSSAGQGALMTPDWGERAKRFLGAAPNAPGQSIIPGGGLLDGVGSSAVGAVVLLAWLAYLPVGYALAAADESSAKSKWGPCMEALAGELREFDQKAEVGRRVIERLREYGVEPAVHELGNEEDPSAAVVREGVNGVLQVGVHRIRLRECVERGTFCLEVTMRAQLLDVATNEPVIETMFVYSNPSGLLRASSEILVPTVSQCRELAAICGDDARKLLRTELSRALDALVKAILSKSPGASAGFEAVLARTAAIESRTAAPARDSGSGSCEPTIAGQSLRADAFERVITDYYEQHPLKRPGGHMQRTTIEAIEDAEVIARSDRVLTVMVKYRWQSSTGDFGGSGISRGIATVESCGSSYRVLAFE